MADDRDIKIYVKNNGGETNEFDSLSANISRHKANGNLEKAVALGQRLAAVRAEDNITDISEFSFSAAQLYQVRVLLTFTAEYSVQKHIYDSFLADAVSSAMYEQLKEHESGYYANISDGGAFSFYLLALKKDGDTAQNIGAQFAMLSSINKPEMVKLGASIFNDACRCFADMISSAKFEIN